MYNLSTDRRPAGNFNLKPFYLQLPIKPTDPDNSIEQINPTELEDYESPIFFTDQKDGSMVFICPTKGYTTKNSKYCRTELREKDEWNFYDGVNILYGQLKVSKVAGGKGIIFGQIHGDDPKLNPQLCKLYYDVNGNIYMQHKNDKNPSGDQIKVKLTTCKIGEIFRFMILLNRGKLTVSVNGKKADVEFKNQYWKQQKWYYKLGAYCQDNQSDDYVQVQFYDLQLIHI